jgi:hypothetical protein
VSREVHAIPPAPRRVRLRVLFERHWILGTCGALLGVYGGLFAFLLTAISGAGLSRSDTELDAAGQPVAAVVFQIDPPVRDADVQKVHFTFRTDDGQDTKGVSLAPLGRHAIGERVDAEYVPANPAYSRIVGTRVAGMQTASILDIWLLAVVYPGLIALAWWLWLVSRWNALLRGGDVAVAEVVEIRPRRVGFRARWTARYRLRDHHARICEGVQSVAKGSALGRRLAQGHSRVAVVHDRSRPTRSSLVLADDFHDANPKTGGMSPSRTGT